MLWTRSFELTLFCATLLVGLTASSAFGETLWSDDFSTDRSAEYLVLEFNPDRDGAVFNYDYSTVGIPPAPNSSDNSTFGVRLFANNPFEDTVPATSGVQITADGLDQALAGKDFTLTYDIWMNTNGPLPGGGTGSTEALMAGVGFSGDFAIEAGNYDGTYFTVTGEAGATVDIRTFANESYNGFNTDGTPFNVTQDDPDYTPALGTDFHPYYYDIFPGGIDVSELPVQGGEDEQTGITRAGQMVFDWHTVRVDVLGTTVAFSIDDLLIAEVQEADVEGNILVGYADYFASEAIYPEWTFGIVDNLRVTTRVDGVTGDYNGNGELDAADMDSLTAAVRTGNHPAAFDLTEDGLVDSADRDQWINEVRSSYYGDSNLDGEFNSSDFVFVFQAGQYEDGIAQNSTWGTGDWDGDGDFGTSDFVAAFSAGGFETGPRAAVTAVPEPTTFALMLLGLLPIVRRR